VADLMHVAMWRLRSKHGWMDAGLPLLQVAVLLARGRMAEMTSSHVHA
jgi:hypothetical protein